MRYYLFLGASILLNATSYVFYKFSSLNAAKRIASFLLLLAGLLIGAANAACYTKSLRKLSLNVAYPTFSAVSILLVSLLSALVFGEAFTGRKVAGIAVILLGVILVSA